jgi:hypothetical protein
MTTHIRPDYNLGAGTPGINGFCDIMRSPSHWKPFVVLANEFHNFAMSFNPQ